MSKIVKFVLFVAITFLFSELVKDLVVNATEYVDYVFFGLEVVLGRHVTNSIATVGTWYVAIPLVSLFYAAVVRQVVNIGRETSKGKVTH